MRDILFSRLLRTPYSERYVLHVEEKDFAALDIHYMLSGQIAATLIILDEKMCPQSNVSELLEFIDRHLLPEASVEEGTLTFTVVYGQQAVNYVQEQGEYT